MANKVTHYECDQPGPLMTKVRTLILEDGRALPDLAADCGVPFYWIRHFLDKKSANPSVNRVEYLYTFLTGKGLFN